MQPGHAAATSRKSVAICGGRSRLPVPTKASWSSSPMIVMSALTADVDPNVIGTMSIAANAMRTSRRVRIP